MKSPSSHFPRHGSRHPAYAWSPSLSPRRPRRGKRAGRRRPRHHPEPAITLVEYLLAHPSIDFRRAGAQIDFDPAANLGELVGRLVLTLVPFLFAYWQFALGIGLAAWAVRRIVCFLGRAEHEVDSLCDRSYGVFHRNRRASVNPAPTADELRAAWEATRGGRRGDVGVLAARLRLGAMLSDLEPAVDQSYIRDEGGTIVGRRPGLRGWIVENAPELFPFYKTLMAYKALADKLRVALGIEEPDTLDAVLVLSTEGVEIEMETLSDKHSTCNDERRKISVDRPSAEGAVPVQGGAGDGGRKAGREGTGATRTTGCGILGLKPKIVTQRSSVEVVRAAYADLFEDGMPTSMAAMEAVVRARLGLVWMVRGRKLSPSA